VSYSGLQRISDGVTRPAAPVPRARAWKRHRGGAGRAMRWPSPAAHADARFPIARTSPSDWVCHALIHFSRRCRWRSWPRAA